jgi:hypothetical protein
VKVGEVFVWIYNTLHSPIEQCCMFYCYLRLLVAHHGMYTVQLAAPYYKGLISYSLAIKVSDTVLTDGIMQCNR